MIRKLHLLDNQFDINLLTKIYFSVIFLFNSSLKFEIMAKQLYVASQRVL